MNADHEAFLSALDALPNVDDDPDLWRTVYELVDRLGTQDPSPMFPALFSFFEQHPHAEHGTPGPLVHLIERTFPGGYEELLLDSLRRTPVPHTLWLANRILNSTALPAPLRDSLTNALLAARSHPASDDLTREQAADFVRHQQLLAKS